MNLIKATDEVNTIDTDNLMLAFSDEWNETISIEIVRALDKTALKRFVYADNTAKIEFVPPDVTTFLNYFETIGSDKEKFVSVLMQNSPMTKDLDVSRAVEVRNKILSNSPDNFFEKVLEFNNLYKSYLEKINDTDEEDLYDEFNDKIQEFYKEINLF
ncbi:MAG: hypothetical protein [Bacteriophage sp.]|nr:MAG: hypothetical protein [Bacteriophage sp.]